MSKLLLSPFILIFCLHPARAEPTSLRATIAGSGGNGRCSIEVTVDGAAEIEVFSDVGNLRTLSGQPAQWNRFHCNAPLPHMPHDFRLVRVAGRGSVQVIHDPRGNRGTAVIHVRDPQAGRDRYMLDLMWSGPAQGGGRGTSPVVRAVQACQDSVGARLNRDGYSDISFERTIPDDNPGRHDWIRGVVSGRRRHDMARFSFSCSVDFNSARVRFVDVHRR